MALYQGDLFDGRYRIQRRLGGGNFGDVYLAEEEQGGSVMRKVALKVLKPDAGGFGQPDAAEDLAKEYASMVAAVEAAPLERKKHFIQVYGMGEAPQGVYMAMELLEQADTLEKVIARHRAAGFHPQASMVLRYAKQLFAALDVLHTAGYVHCDIKPDNLYVQGDTLRVGDFGLTVRTQSFLQESGQAGQIYYMSPEAYASNVSTASDVYSAGLTVYELWTNVQPFIVERHPLESQEETHRHQLRLRDNWAYVPGRQVSPTVDASDVLDAVLERCLQRSLAERFRNAGEALEALEHPVERVSPLEQSLSAAKQLASEDPAQAVRLARAALSGIQEEGQAKLTALLVLGEALEAAGDAAAAMEQYAAAWGMDGRLHLLAHEQAERVGLLERLIRVSKASGKASYAAMYQRRLDALLRK